MQQDHFIISDPESLSDLSPGNQNSRPFFIALIYFYSDHIVSNVFITEYLKMRGKESEFFVIFISSLYFVFLLLFIFRRGPDVPDRVNV